MHLHLVQFKILERQGFNQATVGAGALELLGSPRPPAANEAGWKDTAVVQPRDVLTILVRFDGYAGRYVYHCHMLEHEDNDMMRPYEVVEARRFRDQPGARHAEAHGREACRGAGIVAQRLGVTGAGGVGGVAQGILVKSKKSSRLGCAASRAVRCAEGR